MRIQLQSATSIIFLTIFNFCVSVQAFAGDNLNNDLIINSNNNLNKNKLILHKSISDRHKSLYGIPDENRISIEHLQQYRKHHELSANKNNDSALNFLLIDYLADGEMERRISFNGISAKETSIGNSG